MFLRYPDYERNPFYLVSSRIPTLSPSSLNLNTIRRQNMDQINNKYISFTFTVHIQSSSNVKLRFKMN